MAAATVYHSAMREGTLQRQIVRLIVFRVVIVTTLMGTLFAIQLSPEGGAVFSFNFIYNLSGITYGLSILYLLLLGKTGRSTLFIYFQLFADAALITGLVYYTGGIASPFSFLYLLTIITAVIMLYRRGGFLLASVSGIAYGALVDLQYLGLLPVEGSVAASAPSPYTHYYSIFLHFFAFYAVSFLVSYLAENLKRTGSILEEQRGHLADLQVFNELVINSMSSGLITLDLQGRISKVNQVALRLTRYGEGELMGQNILDLLGLPRRYLRLIDRKLSRRRLYRFDRKVTRRDGVTIPVGVSTSLLRDKDRTPLGYIIIFQDLTEMRKLEEDLRTRDRLAVVGEMAADVAHEIRNPLASISGSVQLLSADSAAGEEHRHLLAIIQRESTRLDRSIHEFLSFARPAPLVLQEVNLSEMVRDTATLLRNSDELLPGHQIEVDLPEGEVSLQADGDRLRQVVWNLSRNALKAMAEGGRLTIRLQPPADDMLSIDFSDEGHGFLEDSRRQVFQPFARKFRRGTGLGLAIVYRIIQAHGGRISIGNLPEGGARVRIELSVSGRPLGPPGEHRPDKERETIIADPGPESPVPGEEN
jgi:two-component system sensor histidine kinase PilS (NtrC family)